MTDTSGTAKSPKGVSSTVNVDGDDADEKKEKVKEIPMFQDYGFFLHDTGDTYDGRFEIKKKDFSIKMQGHGVYTTAEGDVYSGNWEANALDQKETTFISYKDGSKYEGNLKDWCYSGKGKYIYPDGTILTGDFYENCPVGLTTLKDPNGHTWLGKADHGFAWCSPVNHFYELLESNIPGAKKRHQPPPVAETTTRTPRQRRATVVGSNVVATKSKTKKG